MKCDERVLLPLPNCSRDQQKAKGIFETSDATTEIIQHSADHDIQNAKSNPVFLAQVVSPFDHPAPGIIYPSVARSEISQRRSQHTTPERIHHASDEG
jgi:hypothetical protein